MTPLGIGRELSLRIGQLGSAGSRVRLASALREAVELANGHQAPLITTRLQRAAIQENDQLLLALAERLLDGELLGAQGVAMTARLVNDRSGPLYNSGGGRSLKASAFEALVALERGHMTGSRRAG